MPEIELPELTHYFSNFSYSEVICRKDNANLTEAQVKEVIRRAEAYPAQQKHIEKLAKALIKYGQHHAYCPLKYGDELNSCTCGLEAAIAKAKKENP